MFTIRYSKFDLAFLDNPFSVVLEEWVAGGGQVGVATMVIDVEEEVPDLPAVPVGDHHLPGQGVTGGRRGHLALAAHRAASKEILHILTGH